MGGLNLPRFAARPAVRGNGVYATFIYQAVEFLLLCALGGADEWVP